MTQQITFEPSPEAVLFGLGCLVVIASSGLIDLLRLDRQHIEEPTPQQ